jgi:hypothetical protein
VGGTLNVTGSTSLTNPVINNIKMGYTTTATAAGTTTLTISSNYRQFFTGSTTQTIVLPVTSTLVTGIAYEIENNSTGLLTVNSSGGNLVGTVPAGVCAHAVCIGTTLTTAADWDWDYISTTTITGTGANVLGTSPTITTPTISSLSSAAATALTLQSAGTTAVTIDTSQNVLVGTTTNSASTKVAILGSNLVNGISVRNGTIAGNYESSDATRTSYWQFGRDNISTGNYVFTYNGSQQACINTSGNMGIGTSSPGVKLDVSGEIRSNVSGGTPAIYFGDGTYQTSITGPSNSIRFIGDAGAERGRFDNSGNLLVGTTSNVGNAKVSVQGNFASNNGINIDDSNNNSGSTFARFSVSGGTLCGYISRVTTTNAVAYNTTSDYRLKENIVPMTGALSKIAQLKPVTYRWKDCGVDSQGFIAHELQAVVPDCVTGEKDAVDDEGNPKYQGIDTSFLVATLTAAIQELKQINDTQAETINALTARIVALENA